MRIILTFLFSILLFQSYFSQTTEELNLQSKDLLQKGKYAACFNAGS